MELLHPWNFHSSGVTVPRTFVPLNFRSCGTFAPTLKKLRKVVEAEQSVPQQQKFQGVNVPWNKSSKGTKVLSVNLSLPETKVQAVQGNEKSAVKHKNQSGHVIIVLVVTAVDFDQFSLYSTGTSFF